MIYDLAYYDNLLKQYSNTAETINKIRWEFVKEVNPKTVLDFGCGVGWFRAFRLEGVEVDTFDIMPVFQTGITKDSYNLVTFWDSFEHTLECNHIVSMGKHVALTLPILGDNELKTWKHYKPKEHVRLFRNCDEVIEYFNKIGYKILSLGDPECPPRKDIYSFLFKRKD